CAQATGDGRDGQGVADVVAPGAGDVQMAAANSLFAESELFDDAAAGGVLRADIRLQAVEADGEETVVDGEGDGGGNDAASRHPLVDPVAALRGPGRPPDDRADGELTGEISLVGDDPGQGETLAGLTAHGVDHAEVGAEAAAEQGGLRVGGLPGAEPVGVAHPQLAPGGRAAVRYRAEPAGTLGQGGRPAPQPYHGSFIPRPDLR